MTITYVPKNNKKTIEVEGYGKFTVRPYGAGEELQVRANMRELNEVQAEAEALLEKHKGKAKNAKIPEADQKTLAKLLARTDELIVETHELLKGTISSETEGAVDRLFKELDRTEIRRIIDAALLGEVANEPKEPNASA
jgi:hypothetical protein